LGPRRKDLIKSSYPDISRGINEELHAENWAQYE
jgi:hypothetical protein